MADDRNAQRGGPSASQIVSGALEGHAKAIEALGEPMLHGASRGARFIMKKIPGAPALVFDAVDFLAAPNKVRAAFGVAGGVLGGAAGGELGTAAGGINAPIGAAVGSTWGQKIGQDIYDQHADEIDRRVEEIKRGVADTQRSLADTTRWIEARNDELARRAAPVTKAIQAPR